MSSLVETGVDVVMDERGLLADIGNAGRVAPFQPWALALYEYRQSNDLQDDPVRFCISPAGPRHLHTAGGFRIIQDRNFERVYLVFGGGNRGWRVIYMDGRSPPDPEEVVGTYYGHSSGRWDGDVLVGGIQRLQCPILVLQRRTSAHRSAAPHGAIFETGLPHTEI